MKKENNIQIITSKLVELIEKIDKEAENNNKKDKN